MKAKDLAEILLKNPDLNIMIGWEEYYEGDGDNTPVTLDKIQPMEAIFSIRGQLILSAAPYLKNPDCKIWSS